MEQPSLFPFGIRIDEPITTLTDVLVALVCFVAFYRLKKVQVKGRLYLLLRGYFLCMGIATFIGGIIGHGFLYAFSPAWKFPGWATSMIAINLIERAMITYSKPLLQPRWVRFYSWFNILELVVFAALAFTTLDFIFVQIHSAYGLMLFVLGFSIFNQRKRRSKAGSGYFIGAVAVAVLASFFFMSGIGISRWFNNVDISHICLAISAALFYLGAKAMLQEHAREFS